MTRPLSRGAGRAVLVTPGGDAAHADARQVGGKAHALIKLHALGFQVPTFWIVPVCVLAGAACEELRRLSGDFDRSAASTADQFIEAERRFSRLIFQPEVARRLHALIDADLADLLQPDARYAVRSSAVGEDSAEASHAGQFDSFLNVPVGEIVAAILKVWASAYSARVLAYRARMGLRHRPHDLAVIIQEMVSPAVSGVMFTHDPQTGERACVISAVWGLGEGAVADRAESDTYRIGAHCGRIERDVVNKATRVVPAAGVAGGTCLQAVPPELRARPTLQDPQIMALRALADRVEDALHGPQDIEWALDARGEVLLLQARPIAKRGAAPHAARGAHRLWDNSNIVESYPGITLPLTFSFARACYQAAFGRYMTQRALDYRLFGHPLRPHRHLLDTMIGLLNGRVYYNLSSWYGLMSFLPGFEIVKRSWDRMIGVRNTTPWRAQRLGRVRALCGWAWCAWKLATLRGNARAFERRFDAAYRRFAAVSMEALSADELACLYRALAREFAPPWSATLDNDFAAMAYYELLRLLCARWLPAGRADLHNQLLCGGRDLESIEPLRAAAQLAEMVRKDPMLLERFRTLDDAAVWSAVERLPPDMPFRAAIRRFLADYGDRGAEDLKLDRAGLRQRPSRLMSAIRQQLESGRSFAAVEQRERPIRKQAEGDLERLIRSPARRALLHWVLARARFAIARRESMRFARTRLFGLARRLFDSMGDRFARQGLIAAAPDIHYLTIDEVFSVVDGASVTKNLAGLVALRKADYAEFEAQDTAGRMETRGIPLGCDLRSADPAPPSTMGEFAQGTSCCGGEAHGIARVVLDPHRSLGAGAHVLVARSTDPGWVFLMTQACGLIVEKGSVLSHTAIIGRELGIPTIVGVRDATSRIPDGTPITIDGTTGRVAWDCANSLSIAC